MKFYRCEHCGNIVIYLKDAGVPVVCCGAEMQELRPGTVDASVEKHVPLVEKDGSRVTVSVGAAEHPMIPEHFIQWILLETSEGIQQKPLAPGQEPRAVFQLSEHDKVVSAYEYCNLHGLWKA